MILWFLTTCKKLVQFSKKNVARKTFFIADSERSDRGLSIPLLFMIFWMLSQKLHSLEQVVHSEKNLFLNVFNFFVKHWNTFLTPDLEYSERERSEYIYFWLSHSSGQKVTGVQKNLWHILQLFRQSYFTREISIYPSVYVINLFICRVCHKSV